MKNSVDRILIAIFHKDGKDNNNFERLQRQFSYYPLFIPTIDFYGNKWQQTKKYFLQNNFESIFVICSDVTIVCGDIYHKIAQYAGDSEMGMYGFGTIDHCTFPWLRYTNLHTQAEVPFIEGYCFGANRRVVQKLELENTFGYGIEVEMGYKASLLGLKCVIDHEVCIAHPFGKSYDDTLATAEYRNFLHANPDVQNFLRGHNVFFPL